MDLEAGPAGAEIGIPIVVAQPKGLDYAFTQGKIRVLAAMAARCPDKAPVAEAEKKRTKCDLQPGRKKEDVAALSPSTLITHLSSFCLA